MCAPKALILNRLEARLRRRAPTEAESDLPRVQNATAFRPRNPPERSSGFPEQAQPGASVGLHVGSGLKYQILPTYNSSRNFAERFLSGNRCVRTFLTGPFLRLTGPGKELALGSVNGGLDCVPAP